MVTIRTATFEDLKKISQTHIQCFSNSLSSQIGEELLSNYYWEYMKENSELFIVAEDGSEIVGFCMGYLCEKNKFKKKFIAHNCIALAFRVALLVMLGNGVFYKRVSQLFVKNNTKKQEVIIEDTHILEEKGDLLSICVKSSQRGTGVATKLLLEYENRLKQFNRNFCMLSVENNNFRAIHFYEKNGYIIYKKYGKSYQYGKLL